MNVKDVPLDELKLRIDDQLYSISDQPAKQGDLIFDVRDYTYGTHDGEHGGRIASVLRAQVVSHSSLRVWNPNTSGSWYHS